MYIPNHFAVTDPAQQLDLIDRFSFGTLTSVSAGRIRTSHIPFLLERHDSGAAERGGTAPVERGGTAPVERGGTAPVERGGTAPVERGGTAPALFGHVARANSHWSELVGATDLLVSFVGPHAYISPTWYGTPNQVPTWNYVSIEVRGRVQLLDTPAQRLNLVDRLSERHERHLHNPWRSDKLDAKRRSALLDAIVAFRIDIDSIEAKAKLGQNRAPAEVRAAAAELIRRDARSAERQLALLMLEQVD